MKYRVMVMHASEYSIQDGTTLNQGVSVSYYFYGENGEMLKPMGDASGAIGYQRAKCALPPICRSQIKVVPGIYDANMEMTVGSDGKPVTKPVSLEYVSPVAFVMPAVGKGDK